MLVFRTRQSGATNTFVRIRLNQGTLGAPLGERIQGVVVPNHVTVPFLLKKIVKALMEMVLVFIQRKDCVKVSQHDMRKIEI